MASEISICSIALTRCGHSIITSFTEDNKGARLCKLHYPEVRDALLRSHPWNFAVRRVDLALREDAPVFEFGQQFTLPDDCLKIIRTEGDSLGYVDMPYRIEGLPDGSRVLVIDSEAVGIEYIARVTDPNQMDALFRDALSARLAAEICIGLTDNATMVEKLYEIAENKLRMAFTADAQEGTPRDLEADIWLMARF